MDQNDAQDSAEAAAVTWQAFLANKEVCKLDVANVCSSICLFEGRRFNFKGCAPHSWRHTIFFGTIHTRFDVESAHSLCEEQSGYIIQAGPFVSPCCGLGARRFTACLHFVQGMNELLAVILYVLHVEQWPASRGAADQPHLSKEDAVPRYVHRETVWWVRLTHDYPSEILGQLLDAKYIEHDAFEMLSQMMERLRGLYAPST